MKIEKITKKLRDSVIEEIDRLDAPGLKGLVTESTANIAKARQERDENEKYREAKNVVGDFDSGLNEVKGYQGAKISYALLRLREMAGTELDSETKSHLDEVRGRIEAARKSAKKVKAA